ncbi:MAG TPA: hypothetical protein VEI54_02570 [Candidatus Limnocylindrales bacterium]|nr:hypothetical protein [Candidatus Limnocylindrales bacterium]
MYRYRSLFVLSLCLILGAVLTAQEKHPAARTSPAFDQLKSLAGEWQGKAGSGGEPTKVIYKVVSNGSVVMEHMQPAKESEMITMYSLEGDRIVVTHYCSAGNQPTMQTVPLTGATGKYDFSFVRLGGASSPDEGHMVGLSVSITDKDHIAQTWTFQDHGKSMTETFTYTRVK